MGVTCVFRWANATSSSSLTQISDNLTSRLYATYTGRWQLGCKLYRGVSAASFDPASTTGPGFSKGPEKLLLLLTHSLHPAKQYAVVDDTVVEADREMEAIVLKLKNLWVSRQHTRIEGHCYDLGDFQVRIGNLVVGSSPKGLIVEVEYRAANILFQCHRLLAEFIQTMMPGDARLSFATPLLSSGTNSQPTVASRDLLAHNHIVAALDYGPTDIQATWYTPLHTAYQYVALFRKDNLL
ncbi:hypothetical protein IWQ61_003389 [Dispira simplex]|nr:hypothetical protein IWQ61_003389 [Dispira simplex]